MRNFQGIIFIWIKNITRDFQIYISVHLSLGKDKVQNYFFTDVGILLSIT